MKLKKLSALVLSLAMIIGALPTLSLSAAAEETTTTAKNITLGTAALKGGQASNVYFGAYQQSSLGNTKPTDGTEDVDWIKSDTATNNGQGPYYKKEPIKWRVLSNADGKAFLLSDKNLDAVFYSAGGRETTWKTSTIRSWLNGYGAALNQNSIDYSSDNFMNAAFLASEKGVIAETTVVNDDNPTYGTDCGNNTTDKVFLLSIEEVQNTDYGFTDNATRKAVNTAYVYGGGKEGVSGSTMYGVGEADFWWLRSNGENQGLAAAVNPDGSVYDKGWNMGGIGTVVRPAFNLNLSSVLFTSAAKDGKPIETGSLSAVSEYSGNDYKLTLSDSSRNFAITDTTAKIMTIGDTLSLNYTGATPGANEYISAIIANSLNNEVVYYGQLAQTATDSGTAVFELPSDIEAGTYTLKLFNEQINGDYKTDYSSAFSDIALTVPAANANVSFDANGGTVGTASAIAGADGKLTSLPTATRDGYIFKGWFDAKTDGNEITENTIFTTANATIYAQWLKEGTFTVIYKTNAEVEMGRVTYTVGDADNAFPQLSQFGTLFSDFLTRAKQKGSVYVVPENSRWYTDAKFTNSATFPEGDAGEEYTVYCKLTTNLSINGALNNTANNVSYSDIYGSFPAGLWVASYGGPDGRSDADESVYLVFEKKNSDGSWTEVELSNTDASGTTWPNANFFTGVSDNGIYRLKHMGYTATDNDGTALFYDYATDPTNGNYIVQINPVEVTISGVTAVERATGTSNLVALSGGTLSGVLAQDAGKVSFKLGTGTIADTNVGTKPVTTAIKLTGEKAENYTLVQPTDVTVNVKEYVPYNVTVTDGTGGGEYGEGIIVAVKANTPESGKAFKEWTTEDGVTFADSTSEETTFIMPAKNVTVTAVYENVYDVWVGGVRITESNKDDVLSDGTVSYNAETNTLTLNNANITSGVLLNYEDVVTLFAKDDLNIELKGTNRITAPDFKGFSRGISVNGHLTIFGGGSLTAIGGNVTVTVKAGYERNFDSTGIYAYLLTIRMAEVNTIGGTMSVTGDTTGESSDRIRQVCSSGILSTNGDLILEDGAKLNATGGSVRTNTANEDNAISQGIYIRNGDIIVYDAVLTAVGGKVVGGENACSFGICTNYADVKVCDADAKVTLTADDVEATVLTGSNGISVYGGLDIQAGSVSVTSGKRIEGTLGDNDAVYVEGYTDGNGVTHGGNISLASGMKISVPENGTVKKIDDTYYTIVDGSGNIATNVKIEAQKNNYSGGSLSSSSTTTTTTKNDDGSTTKTTTNKSTGTTTETTTYPDGSTTKVETKKDGTVTTTEKKKDGTTVKTETTASGETTAEVKAKGETEVVIPVENADEVTKVIVTDKDGNETEAHFEVKDGGIAISVSGNSTVSVQTGHLCFAKDFTDVDLDAWYHLNIDYVLENGLFKGTTETTFAPNDNLTRAMLVTVLYRAEGEPLVGDGVLDVPPFADVDMGSYYANAVIWAQQNDIVKGVSETEFAPNNNITREQIAAIMHRYAQYKGYDVSVGENTNILSYDDFDSISEYAIGSMQWAVGSGLIKGKSESTLSPLDNATRAEIAAILHRYIEANK